MLVRAGWVVLTGLFVFASNLATAGDRVPLARGDVAPEVAFVDITGEDVDTGDYADWVQVLSFADRESSEELKKWLRPAQLAATSAHPELRVVYVTFADVSAIPRLLRRMVRPMLEKTFENSNEDLGEAYREIGVEPTPDQVAMIFAPDWDGAHLAKFGLADAKSYHLWIVDDGRVVDAIDVTTTDRAARYAAAFDAIAAAPSAKSAASGSAEVASDPVD